ncbi:MAG: pitrilysin family protein [Blastocatellia bacterium]
MLYRLLTCLLIVSLAGIYPLGVFANKKPMSKSDNNSTNASSTASKIFPFPVTEKTLPNGLKILIVPTGFPNLVSLQIPVQTGSRNEVEAGKSGFAHFFEHVMFRGTKNYPSKDYQAILTKIGARQNAYTTDDFTNYHTTFAKDDLDIMLKIEADRFMNLEYSEEDFKTEARAVLGEYNKNSASPINKLIEVQRDNAFSAHTYKHTTMGFLRDIEDMPNQFAYSKQFFDRWYRPEYTTIIIAGDVTPEKAVEMVEKYWGNWQPGKYRIDIPSEPPAKGAVYAHVPWATPTLPYVTVAFRAPAFSETDKEYVAMDLLLDLYFGPTSDIYRKLVQQEQKVDQFFPYLPSHADPTLATVGARLKKAEDAMYVRDLIMETFATARANAISPQLLADGKSNGRYSFVRAMDNTEAIASTLARFVRFRRSADTLNNLYDLYLQLSPADLQAVAKKYFTDENLVITTLAKDSFPAEIGKPASIATYEAKVAPKDASDLKIVLQKTASPQLNVKLLFSVGSAYDPKGKEGLSSLAAAMISEAGSKEKSIDEINKAFFPIAASFGVQVDKEMTTFTGVVHKDNLATFSSLALTQLLNPGFREEDFKRLKEQQLNTLKEDLRASNEEELGKERLQQNIFAGTPYGHPVLGTVAGIESITLDDVKNFVRTAYTRANLMVGMSGDVPDEFVKKLSRELSTLAAGPAPSIPGEVKGRMPQGMEVEIIEKDTLATAISFGFPIEVNRSHPDFAALWLARAWLGEHRSSVSHLYERIREIRGMNYGDYAYIEAFPRGMFQFFPDPNIARRAQIFEIWIRPVVPSNAHFALRIATHELEKLVENGMSQENFEAVREYLMKNVFVMTATQNQQLGYALDSKWYQTGEFTSYMREKLQALSAADVNKAIKKHLNAKNMHVVMITKDAESLRKQLVEDSFSAIKYDANKPQELLEEDKLIGSRKLNIRPEAVKVTKVDDVFAR